MIESALREQEAVTDGEDGGIDDQVADPAGVEGSGSIIEQGPEDAADGDCEGEENAEEGSEENGEDDEVMCGESDGGSEGGGNGGEMASEAVEDEPSPVVFFGGGVEEGEEDREGGVSRGVYEGEAIGAGA